MTDPVRHRPYLDHPRPLAQATIATRALNAISGDEDQPALVRPYVADPHHIHSRRRANRWCAYQLETSLALLGMLSLAQSFQAQEGQ